MGCSESKQGAVATGNTIFRRKQSNNGSSKNSKDMETVQETAINDGNTTTNSAAPQQQQPESDNVEAESGGGGEVPVDVKDIINENSHESLKIGKENVEGGNNNGDVEERLISKESPNHFFSSRKDEELGIDGIVSEGRSGKSEYNTPRHGTGKLMNLMSNENLKDDNDDHNAVEEKELADHEEKPEAEEKENGKEETVIVEENLVKEEEEEEEEEEPAKTTVEENVSSPAQENKSDALNNAEEKVEEKHMVESPNQDLKTT